MHIYIHIYIHTMYIYIYVLHNTRLSNDQHDVEISLEVSDGLGCYVEALGSPTVLGEGLAGSQSKW